MSKSADNVVPIKVAAAGPERMTGFCTDKTPCAIAMELRGALSDIRLRADSDASSEELEDAQADLRYIYAKATAALKADW